MYYKDKNFGFFDYEQLTKDVCYNKPLTFFFQTHNPRTRFQFSNVVEVKSGKCIFTDNTKIVHRAAQKHMLVTNFALHNMRLYYGYQLASQQGNDHQQSTILYSRMRSDRKLQNASFTTGLQRKTARFQLDTNVSIFLSQRKNDYYIYSKLLYLSKHFNFGLLSIFDYGCANLQTNNIVLQVKPHEKHQIFVRGEVDGVRNYSLKYSKIGNYFDYFIVNYLVRPTSSLSLMAQIKYDANNSKIKNIQSIIEKKFAHNKLKLGLNQCGDVIMQFQFPLNVGKASNLDLGMELSDILKSRKISYGIKINLNV